MTGGSELKSNAAAICFPKVIAILESPAKLFFRMKRNPDAPKMPLHPLDTEKQTFGCRHTNPDICSHNGIAGKCAFKRSDNICIIPPTSWGKIYQALKTGKPFEKAKAVKGKKK